jgi:hypothetical protein
MSIGAVSLSTPATISRANSAQSQPQAKATPTTPTTSTASNVAAALKEATETAAQTAKEAGHGDRQAQRLIQKQQHQPETSAAPKLGVVNGSGQITGQIINTKA